jgi:polyphosphate kinase
MKHYAHLGTGNYNPRTAKVYTDLSYFTARTGITGDVAQLFNSLTGFGRSPVFRHLLVAPYNLHRRIGELIAREAKNAAAGKPARIIVKMNALVDRATIESLYAASQAGVKIDLIIRGVCCLVPGVKGLSENIRVRSIVGRYLEHARAIYFENADAEPLILAGSADWMTRNFFRRIEVVFPIEDQELRRWMMREFFPTELRDNANAYALRSDGTYRAVPRRSAARAFSAQDHLMAAANARARA